MGGASDIKMRKQIRPAYVIFSHKRLFFVQNTESVIKTGSIVTIYIAYKLSSKSISSSSVLKNSLFGAIKVKNPITQKILKNIFILDMAYLLNVLVNLHIVDEPKPEM